MVGVPYSVVKTEHMRRAHHPSQDKDPSSIDWAEACCDWQASGYTKPDSLLDARETAERYYSWAREYLEPVLDKYKF